MNDLIHNTKSKIETSKKINKNIENYLDEIYDGEEVTLSNYINNILNTKIASKIAYSEARKQLLWLTNWSSYLGEIQYEYLKESSLILYINHSILVNNKDTISNTIDEIIKIYDAKLSDSITKNPYDNSGNLNYTSMVDNPKTFITTIGLYNDSNDLVAVAKVSQPISKDFSKEALMRVKLDY